MMIASMTFGSSLAGATGHRATGLSRYAQITNALFFFWRVSLEAVI